MKRLQQDQHGLAHLGLIILVVVVVGVIGFAGYAVMNKNKKATDTVADTVSSKAAQEDCEKENDKDICKFMASWKASTKYRMTSTEADGTKTLLEIDGNKNRFVMTGETSYEVVTIDKTTYTKAGSVWYKQTIKEPKDDVASSYKQDFADSQDSSTTDKPEAKTVYKSLGKEACDSLTCFKYEVVDPTITDGGKQYIWFDTKDYQLRKSQTVSSEGTHTQIYEYANVTVSVPSPVKELGPNQYIVPGQSEPMTIPSGAAAAAEDSGE